MKEYHNGPIPDEKRNCTDAFCCVILIVLVSFMFGVGVYSWTSNNFTKLLRPYDAVGKGCGVDYPEYPYIYFVSPDYENLWRTVCVKSCPTASDSILQCQPNKFITSCNKVQSNDSSTAVNIYATTPIRSVICLPDSDALQEKITTAISGDSSWMGKVVNAGNVYPILLASIPIAIILSIMVMCFIRFTAKCFIYFLIILSILACIGLGSYIIAIQASGQGYEAVSPTVSIILGALLIIFGILIVVGVCFFKSRIQLASIIVQVSARFVKENVYIALLPLLLFFLMISFLALWFIEALGYYSMGTPATQTEKQLPFQHFQTTNFVKVIIVVHVFQLLWVLLFLIETNAFLINGAATSWYFQSETPYSDSSFRYRRYHIGSVAMGSFFMALFGIIKFIYELLTPEQTQSEGCMAKWKKMCDCICFLCVSYLFNCFNSGAYTMVYLSSHSYCDSAWEIISVKIKEPVATAVVGFMSVLFSILMRVGITALTVLICYLIIKNVDPWKSDVTDASGANVLVGVLSFVISSLFVSLYSEAMDAIYLCYLIDKDAGGTDDKAPDELKNFLEQAKKESNVQPE